jgi:polysaccharide pyruvyl transferase CsaB
MRCLLVGNYGVGNLGDEALREYFLQAYPEVEWSVLSQNPENGEYARLPGGARSLLSLRWLRTLRAYARADAVVFGGGSLFTDVESVYACMLWCMHAAAARLFGKPVILAFQGVGPFRSGLGRRLAAWTVRVSVSISVRDPLSHSRVQEFQKNKKVIQSSDPVFSLLINKKITNQPKNVFIIIPRHNSDQKFQDLARKYVSEHQNSETHILTMQPDSQEEQSVIKRLQAVLGVSTPVRPVLTLDGLAKEVSGASFVLTQRYHGAIAALALGVPVEIVPQGEGDKLSTLVGADAAALEAAVEAGASELRRALAAVKDRS